jgi:hypothetical protein
MPGGTASHASSGLQCCMRRLGVADSTPRRPRGARSVADDITIHSPGTFVATTATAVTRRETTTKTKTDETRDLAARLASALDVGATSLVDIENAGASARRRRSPPRRRGDAGSRPSARPPGTFLSCRENVFRRLTRASLLLVDAQARSRAPRPPRRLRDRQTEPPRAAR